MSVDITGGTGTEPRPTYAEQPEEPELATYWKRTIRLMSHIDSTSRIVEEAL